MRHFFPSRKQENPWPLFDLITALGHHAVTDYFRAQYPAFNALEQAPPGEFLLYCLKYSTKSAPTSKWAQDARTAFEPTPVDKQQMLLAGAFRSAIKMLQEEWQAQRSREHPERHHSTAPDWLNPMIWYAGKFYAENRDIRQAIIELAEWSFRKIPGAGTLSTKTGIACVRAFSFMPVLTGIPLLLRFQKKAGNRSVRNIIDRILDDLAAKNHLTKGELKELNIPDFGLDKNDVVIQNFGMFEAVLSLKNQAIPQIQWQRVDDGKVLKSAPASVKAEYPFELQALRQQLKDLKSALGSCAATIESAWLERRNWTFGQLTSRLLQHPVLKAVASRLIWHFDGNGRQANGIFHEKCWQNPNGEALDWMQPDTRVTLWHPIADSAEQVLAWRNWLQSRMLTQPFKQAYREIYVVTPPEQHTRSYSNRFAAHILRQAQFAALANLRDWHFKAPNMFEEYSAPWREAPAWQYRIEFWISGEGDFQDYFDFSTERFVFTDQVRFSYQERQVNVDEVPPLLFSELMRDVDLFVGVCSIGNDPDWQDRGDERFQAYWRQYAFSEELSANGELRMEALKRIVPRLKIGAKCRFEGKYLLVEGTKHTYKIHCGSGNILMSPNDQYLCIVPDQSVKQGRDAIYLPFEGDALLSIIISKALLLAADDQITDATILRQI